MKRLSIALLLLLVTLSLLSSCSDDEMLPAAGFQPVLPDGNADSRSAFYTSSLVQDENGHWKANRRVPLVGQGRVVDDVAKSLISVASGITGLSHLIDEDLTNCATFGAGLAGVDAVTFEVVSIRDLNRTYAGGQKVGFVFKPGNSGLLTLEVLKSFWIRTYKDGKLQESFGNTEGTEVLGLDLISVANNDEIKELAVEATLPFDEVQFYVAGVSANVLKNLKIYYAFVGENTIKSATAGSNWFPNAHLHKGFLWTNILNSEHIVDNDLGNYAYYGTLSGLLGDPHATVDFGREIPAGSEVGFVISNVDVLNIDVLGEIILTTYDEKDEEQDRATFTNVLGLSLIKVGNHSRVSMKTTKPCTQVYINFAGLEIKLGGTKVYYAYASDPVTVDISSRFAASDVTITSTSYTLPTPPGGTTTWQIVDAVPGTMPEIMTFDGNTITKIIGMSKNGKYRLRGTFIPDQTEGETATPITIEFVITRDAPTVNENCNHVIDKTQAEVADIKGGGSLISIGKLKNPEYIVDNDPLTHATLVDALGIAQNVGIVAIQLKQPIEASDTAIKRVGFTIRNTFNLLNADILKFFQVRLFNNGNPAGDGVVNNSEVGDVGLIGGKGNKIRMSIRAKLPFDRIELWKVGALGINLETFHIYNAFWENANEEACPIGDISEACMEMLTSAQGAEINYDASTPGDGLVSLGSIFVNMDCLMDNDPDNFSLCNATDVLGTEVISIKFPPLKKGSTIGFVLEKPEGVIDANVFSGTQLEVWSHGVRVNKKYTGDLLDIGLLGHERRIYVETRVTEVEEFDEVRIAFPTIAGVANTRKIYGAFTRRDTDMNGIPDCAEDIENPKDPVEMLMNAKVRNPHICLHESLVIDVTGAKPEDTYTLVCWNTSKDNEMTEFQQKVTVDSDGKQSFVLKGLEVGEYFIRIKKGNDYVWSSALEAYVHPLLTTWKKDAQSTDWNRWENWTEGAPWTCSDVILPTGCVRYPVLQDLSKNTQGLRNYCANLHIESHAELVNTHLLDQYDYAWMELTLESGKNYILSSPLTNTVTGDYFVPAKWAGNHAQEHKFVRLTSTNSPENRFAPRLYQRCWSSAVPGKVLTDGLLGTTVITSETDWTAPFNAVAEPIREGMGWMVRAENEGLNTRNLTFRFPKTHGDYSYFAADGSSTGTSESVARNTATMGHFVVDRSKRMPYTVTVNNLREGSTFVVGNPFAAHLNIARFLEANKAVISEVKLTNGNGTHTVLYQHGKVTATVPGFTHIAPMQGFYVTAINPAQELKLTFTEGMQEQMPGYNIYANGESEPEQPVTRAIAGEDVLRITAKSGGKSTQCVVKFRPDSERGFRPGEDSRLLYDGENPPMVAVFTVADGIAADIQQLPSAGTQSVSLGWRMEHPRDLTLQFSHPAHSEWKGWVLENRETGRRVALDKPETFVNLDHQSTRIGGWRLVKKAM